MGRYGPPPKAPEKRHGHCAKKDRQPFLPVAGAAAEQPVLGFEVHPLAADWYDALAGGPEAQFYSPALWQRARIVARMLSGLLESGRPSSTLYAALQSDMRALMVDAAELRRLGIAVQPPAPGPRGNVIDWRTRVDERAGR